MKNILYIILFSFCYFSFQPISAQCPGGQVEVEISVETDNWGYETYWELVQSGNNCGTSTLFAGGNSTQVGCNGGGQQDATPGNGYANNATINEGPWCLTTDGEYDIISIDDYGDGGAKFLVEVNGFEIAELSASGDSNTETFIASEPPLLDLSTHHNLVFDYTVKGSVVIRAEFMNEGQLAITSFDFNYSIDGGATQTQSITGVNIPYTEEVEYSHNTSWDANSIGIYNVDVWVSNINGQGNDENASNDHNIKQVSISSPVPNIIDSYLNDPYSIQEIAGSGDQINKPRDLDFHPEFSRKELWVINMGTENSGGSTVIISNAGDSTGQSSEYLQDGNAWHFMSLPTALAFGENGNWATSAGVQDANHSGGTFTGPSLWSSDPAIYAVVGNPPTAEFNGSHLDMLHGSPYSMGIAHLEDNTYFVYDSYNNDIVKYAFNGDHGPGKDDHTNGEIWRYTELNVQRDGVEIPNHMVINKTTGQLYISDHKNSQVLRMDVNSGNVTGNLPLTNETLAVHAEVTNVDWEAYITNDLSTPCGIDVQDDRLVVGDYSSGEILIFDISGTSPLLMGAIATNASGLMGIKIGPEGRIWYVDAVENTVNKVNVSPSTVGIVDNLLQSQIAVYPNPTIGFITVKIDENLNAENLELAIIDVIGKRIAGYNNLSSNKQQFDLTGLPSGTYFIEIKSENSSAIKQIVKK